MKALGFVVLLCAVAAADTGGSMGGGSWSSSSSSSSSSSGGSYHSSSSWSSSDSGSGGLDPTVEVLIFFGVIIWFGISEARKSGNDSSGVSAPLSAGLGAYTPISSVDIGVVRIAIDGRARGFVQTELKKIADRIDTSTPDGRAAMLREVALLLRRLRDAWVYGGAVNEPMRDMSGAKPVFDRYVDDARSRFREETIRNEQGARTAIAASSYTPHSDEGPGLILVSIIIAAHRELFTVSQIGNGDELRQALDAASQLTPANLVAIEIVWQPSEDADRLSSIALEAKAPDMVKLPGALVGKTFCAYCGGPYPAELVSCPHCGASGRQAA